MYIIWLKYDNITADYNQLYVLFLISDNICFYCYLFYCKSLCNLILKGAVWMKLLLLWFIHVFITLMLQLVNVELFIITLCIDGLRQNVLVDYILY